MSANEESTSVVVTGIFLFVAWLVALFHAPLVTILITFLVIVLGGTFMTSGNGDGRNGRH